MVGGGIKRIEIKSVEKIFLIGVWLEGEVEKKKIVNSPGIFISSPSKYFFSKIEKQLERKLLTKKKTKK